MKNYTIEWESRGVYVRFSGNIYFEDVLDAVQTLGAHPSFDGMAYWLFDFSGVSAHYLTTEEMAVIDSIVFAQHFSNWKMHRLYVVGMQQQEKIERMRKEHQGQVTRFETFLSLHDARQWISRRVGS
jgi:hypothetical protein